MKHLALFLQDLWTSLFEARTNAFYHAMIGRISSIPLLFSPCLPLPRESLLYFRSFFVRSFVAFRDEPSGVCRASDPHRAFRA